MFKPFVDEKGDPFSQLLKKFSGQGAKHRAMACLLTQPIALQPTLGLDYASGLC